MSAKPNPHDPRYTHPPMAGVSLTGVEAEAESKIDAGEGPDALRSLLPTGREAAEYFAHSLADRFPCPTTAGPCRCCHQPTHHGVRLDWRAILSMKTLQLQISHGRASERFSTYHLICLACSAGWRRGLWRAKALRYVAYFLLAVSALHAILAMILAGKGIPNPLRFDLLWHAVPIAGALFWQVSLMARAARIPDPIRWIHRDGVDLIADPHFNTVQRFVIE